MPFYKDLRTRDSEDYAARAVSNLLALRKQISKEIPSRTISETLLLATWNIRDFDSNKFGHGPRLPETYYYIAEIIAAFDLVAVQEINEDLRPLKKIVWLLGPNWDYIVTDVTAGSGGNGERLAFVFDKRKVQFRNIASELVLPDSYLIGGQKEELSLPKSSTIEFTENASLELGDGTIIEIKKGQILTLPEGNHKVTLPEGQKIYKLRQFARTPFCVAFQAGWFKFTLCTVHLYFGASSGAKYKRRVAEINAVSKFLANRSKSIRKKYKTGENFIILGDFNIVNGKDDTFKALKKNGFTVPQGIYQTNAKMDKSYDQIAFMVKKDELILGDSPKNSGIFSFFKSVYPAKDAKVYYDLMQNTRLRDYNTKGKNKGKKRTAAEKKKYYTNEWRTWQMSDHLPLWVELKIDFSEEYLKRIKKNITT